MRMEDAIAKAEQLAADNPGKTYHVIPEKIGKVFVLEFGVVEGTGAVPKSCYNTDEKEWNAPVNNLKSRYNSIYRRRR